MKARKCFLMMGMLCLFSVFSGDLAAGPGDVVWDHPFQIDGGYYSWRQKVLVNGGRLVMAGNAIRLDPVSGGRHLDGVLAAFDPANRANTLVDSNRP